LAIAKELYEEKKSEGFRQIRVASAYTQLGTALAAQAKDFAAALAAFEGALALSDAFAKQPGLEISEALLLNSTAWLLATCPDESLVDTPRALKLATKAVSITPNSATNVSTLAFAQHLNGNHEKAIKTFQQSTQLDADLIALNTLMTAMCYAKLGKIDQANDLYNKAVQLNKANPQEPELFERYRIQAEKLFRAEQEKLQ
jgi:tetratricopeptide (TPR) repeat protein